MTDIMPDKKSRPQRYQDLAHAFRPPKEEDTQERSLAYTRLFLGPGRPVASPFESVYIEGCLMGESTEQVARCYVEAGVQVSATLHEPPDHVSLELAFMADLAFKEEQDPNQAQSWRQQQRHFLQQHLARWLPEFCQKIMESDTHPFYHQAALDAKRLLEEDFTRLHSTITDPKTGLTDHIDPYTQPRSSSKISPRRSPNMQIHVDPSGCTLCTLCSDNCRPGALTIGQSPRILALMFNPSHCNGCRVCLRLCPEGVITLKRGPSLTEPISSMNQEIFVAPRVMCPNCQRPHIAVPWLERLTDQLGGGETVRRSLALCPLCKVRPMDPQPDSIDFSQESLSSA